jgi:uroporphyrinogen-III synthase
MHYHREREKFYLADLTSKRILITRPKEQAAEFSTALKKAGAVPINFPVIEIKPIHDSGALDKALEKLDCYDWLVLTSVNGVKVIFERMEALKFKGFPPGLRIAAIGPKTAEALQKHHLRVDFFPQEYVAEAILPGLGELIGKWVLLLRADKARQALPDAIERAGGIAHEISVYSTLPAQFDPIPLENLRNGLDFVTFTSSSTVLNFLQITKSAGIDPYHLPGNPVFACIGPITAQTARKEGFEVAIVAEAYTTQGLLQAMLSS